MDNCGCSGGAPFMPLDTFNNNANYSQNNGVNHFTNYNSNNATPMVAQIPSVNNVQVNASTTPNTPVLANNNANERLNVTTNAILTAIAKNNNKQMANQGLDQRQQNTQVNAALSGGNSLINNISKDMEQNKTVKESVESTGKETYKFVMRHVLLGFVLVAAFAWHDAIKYYISRTIKLSHGSPYYYLYYALTVTLITVIVVRVYSSFAK